MRSLKKYKFFDKTIYLYRRKAITPLTIAFRSTYFKTQTLITRNLKRELNMNRKLYGKTLALMALTFFVAAGTLIPSIAFGQQYTSKKLTYFALDDNLSIVEGSSKEIEMNSVFTWADDHKSFVMKTPEMESTYFVDETLNVASGEAYRGHSDAGNEYYFMFNDQYVTFLSKKDKFSLVYTVDQLDKNYKNNARGGNGDNSGSGKRKGVWKN